MGKNSGTGTENLSQRIIGTRARNEEGKWGRILVQEREAGGESTSQAYTVSVKLFQAIPAVEFKTVGDNLCLRVCWHEGTSSVATSLRGLSRSEEWPGGEWFVIVARVTIGDLVSVLNEHHLHGGPLASCEIVAEYRHDTGLRTLSDYEMNILNKRCKEK